MPETDQTIPKRKNPKGFKALILLAILIAAVAASVYLFQQWQQTKKELDSLKKNPNQIAQNQVKAVVAKVGKFIALPEKEDPTLATINDISKLKDQPFFAKAQNGDQILIYTNARKAYLYSPTQDKLLDVAPLNIGTPSATPAK